MADWTILKSPTLSEFEAIADASFAQLPQEFRNLCQGVVIRVDDFPDEDVLKEMEAETPFDLLGLFTGIGMPYEGGGGPMTGQMPNLIHLYRRPILDYWAEHEETLGHLIRHVLVHEIGHHFGLSDEDMERIETEADEMQESK
ncbi:MAG: metallopeptidase family protein [Beijerinckiaceae bacterium]